MKFVSIFFFPTLFIALNLADLDGGLILISLIDGVITFLLIKLKINSSFLLTGKYLETVLYVDTVLKKNLHILSSIEWKVTVAITPSFDTRLHDFESAEINSLISLLTEILNA